jgi:mRNA interferase RelE/StbE
MARYRVEIKKSAAKEIEKLPRKDIQAVLHEINVLSKNPRPHGCKKLSADQKYRVRCGNYRILYSIEDEILTVFIVKVRHRKDVYRD